MQISKDSFKNARIKPPCHFVLRLMSSKEADVICISCLKPGLNCLNMRSTTHAVSLFHRLIAV